MNTIVKPITEESLREAAEILRDGGVVGMPTETVYGLAANALNEAAVKSIFAAKGRPGDNPLIVHISREAELAPLIRGDITREQRLLMDAFWPGPMTLIFDKSALVPDAVTAGLSTVAIRMPAHPGARAIIRASGLPLAAPSANLSGKPSPTTAQRTLEDMDGRVPYILDGGPCQVGVESTVIDARHGVAHILRPGGITPEMVEQALVPVELDKSLMRPLQPGETASSPGMKYKHYAPKGEMTIYRGSEEAVAEAIRRAYDQCTGKAVILCQSRQAASFGKRSVISMGDGAESVAHSLFDALRDADDLGAERIFAAALPMEGVGLAVMNRMARAAAFRIVDV